jgi:CRP-like cAMP-binding protein/predicted acylesterase/phospholipase RssA
MERTDVQRVLRVLRVAPLFRGLRARRLRQLLAASRLEDHAPGTVILRQGTLGDAYYVVIAGQVAVRTGYPPGEATHLATLGPGQGFGEMALLGARRRTADVVAATAVQVLAVPRVAFEGYLLTDAGFKARLVTQSQEREAELFRQRLARSLQSVPLFAPLRWEELLRVAAGARLLEVPAGEVLCREGEEPRALYVLLAGELELRIRAAGAERRAATLTPGASVGDRALLSPEPLPATLVATRASTLVALDKPQLDAVLAHGALVRTMGRLFDDGARAGAPARDAGGRGGTVVAVVGHEPDAGSAALAVNLGLSLAAQVGSVALLDLAPDQAAVRYAGLEPSAAPPSAGAALDAVREAPGGLAVLGLPGGRRTGPALLEPALAALRHRYGFVLAHGLDEPPDAAAAAVGADTLVLVTRGTGPRLGDGAAAPQTERLVVYTPDAMAPLLGWEPVDAAFRLPSSPHAREQFAALGVPFVRTEPRSFLSRGVGRIARYLTRQQVGLVLSGSSATAPVQAGVLAGLEERSVDVDLIVATGVGGLLAAAYATGLPIQALERLGVAFQTPLEDLLAPRTARRAAVVRGRRLRHLLRSLFAGQSVEGLQVPLWLGAVDPDTGEDVVLGAGPLVEALEASLGLSGFGRDSRHQGRPLLEASVLHPLPLRFVREMGADVVVAVAPDPASAFAAAAERRAPVGRRRAPLHLAMLTLRLAAQRLAATSVEAADVLITPHVARATAGGRARFQAGREAASAAAPRVAALQAARLRQPAPC